MLDINAIKNSIKDRYKYDEDFAETIAIAVESIVDYYSAKVEDIDAFESKIIEALYSCPIYVTGKKYIAGSGKKRQSVESLAETLSRENVIDGTNNDVIRNFEGMTSAYISYPNLQFENDRFLNKGVTRAIVLPHNFTPSSPSSVGLLVRYLDELVSSYIGEYSISGQILTQRRGLELTKYDLKNNDGVVNRTVKSKSNSGLERGILDYEEMAIMRSELDESYDLASDKYQNHRIIAGSLSDGIGLSELIIRTRLSGDKRELKEYLDRCMPNGYDAFVKMSDKLFALENERLSSYGEDDRLKIAIANIDNYYSENIAPTFQEFAKNVNLQEREKSYGIRKSA